MASKRKFESYSKIKKTKEMAELFKRKSGPINKKPSRTKQKEEWMHEVEQEIEEVIDHEEETEIDVGTD